VAEDENPRVRCPSKRCDPLGERAVLRWSSYEQGEGTGISSSREGTQQRVDALIRVNAPNKADDEFLVTHSMRTATPARLIFRGGPIELGVHAVGAALAQYDDPAASDQFQLPSALNE
jgi:hypothetical protein